jgi:hypothetical protein
MSTHALIGVPTTSGYKARYVHCDGYTSAMLPSINRCVNNMKAAGDTFTDAVNYMLSNHWSSFSLGSHKAAEAHSHNEVWYTEKSDIDAEYLYILDDSEVIAYIRTGEGWMALNPNNTIAVS